MIKVRRGLGRALVSTGTGFAQPNGEKSKGKQQLRESHRAERINMAQRVQAQAAEQLRGTVAEIARGPAVRYLMQGNGE